MLTSHILRNNFILYFSFKFGKLNYQFNESEVNIIFWSVVKLSNKQKIVISVSIRNAKIQYMV